MGTSASYRSPRTTKWNAVRTAVVVPHIPPERAVAEVWSAADADSLVSDEVVEYYKAWLQRAVTLGETTPESPSRVIQQIAEEARHASLAKGSSVLAAAAERALVEVCRASAVRTGSFAAADPKSVRERWKKLASQSSPVLTEAFISRFVRYLTQFYVSRDLAEFVGTEGMSNTADFSARVDELARGAEMLVKSAHIHKHLSADLKPKQMWRKAMQAVVKALRDPARGG